MAEGFPWEDLREIFSGCQRMAKVPNAVEILPKIWTVWVGRTSVTDDRQTDGRATANSQRQREFTFAKNLALLTWQKQNFAWLSSCHYCVDRVQNLPESGPRMYSECSRFHPNWFTFGGVIPLHRQSALDSESKIRLKHSFEPNKSQIPLRSLVRSWFEAGRRQVRSWSPTSFEPASEMEFGFNNA